MANRPGPRSRPNPSVRLLTCCVLATLFVNFDPPAANAEEPANQLEQYASAWAERPLALHLHLAGAYGGLVGSVQHAPVPYLGYEIRVGSNEIGPTLGALAFARIPASNNLAIGFDLGFSVGPYFQSGDCVLGLFCEEQFEWDRVYMLNTAISLERRETSGFAYRSYVGVKTPVSSPGPPDRGFDGDGDPLSRPRQSASSALPYLGAAIGYAF